MTVRIKQTSLTPSGRFITKKTNPGSSRLLWIPPLQANPPSAPFGVSATSGILSATVNWSTPISDGGSAITGYTVVCIEDGTKNVTVGVTNSATVTSLSSGTPYTFVVYATNSIGNSPNSSASSPVTPTAPGYTLTAGTKAPVLGSGAQSPFPAAGWSTAVAASGDDANINVSLPFTWTFNGTGYTSFYPGSNTYITFGAGSTQWNNLSAINPPNDKIHIAAADNSWQRVSHFTSGTDYVRLRYEGTSGTSGSPGFPDIVYEITFFNPILTGGNPWVELLIGSQARGTSGPAISGMYNSAALLSGGGMGPTNQGVAANQSYVLVGNSTGTTWTVNTGYYAGGTGY